MKKRKGKLLISLLTVFMMVFAIIPCMGISIAEADSDPYVYENSSWSGITNLIKTVKYKENGDGTFNADIYYDLSEVGVAVLDNDVEGMGYESRDSENKLKNLGTYGSFDKNEMQGSIPDVGKGLNPGETWKVKIYLAYDSYADEPLNVNFAWLTLTVPQIKVLEKPQEPTTPPAVVKELKDKTVEIKDIKKDHLGQTIYTEKFYIDSSVSYFSVEVNQTNISSQDYNWILMLEDPNGKVVSAIGDIYGDGAEYGSFDETKSGFSTKGYYTLKLICGYTGLSTIGYKLNINLKKAISYSYKYTKATAQLLNDGSYLIQGEGYDGNDALKPAIYRENLTTGKFMLLKMGEEWSYDETNKTPDTTYKYYVVNYNKVSASGLPTDSNEISVSSTAREALNKYAATATIKTAPIIVANVTDLKIKKQGVKQVELEWFWDSNVFHGFVVQSYDDEGNLFATKYYSDGRAPGNTIYIPYSGTTNVRVMAFFNDSATTTIFGEPTVIKATSAKISAPSANVTKISTKKAKITVYKSGDGVQVQQKVGKKWKDVTKGSTASTYKKTWSKNSAGKTSYRARAYVKDGGKTYYSSWKTYKPKSNYKTYTKYGVSYMRNTHAYGDVFFLPTKVEYKGSKIKVTGRFYNTWKIIRDSGKFKITYKADGKTIGSKTISVKNMKANSYKTTTFYLSGSKKDADLRCASYTLKTLK